MRLPKHFSSSLVVVILGAVVLSSCGTTATLSSSTTTTKTTQTTTSQPTMSTTTATTSTTSTAPPSTTTTTSSIQQSNVVTRCHASQLSFSYSWSGFYASAQLNVFFGYTNTSSVTCTLYGYPGIEFYTANGQPIIAKTRRGGAYPASYDPGPHLVTLTPGTNVYFYVGWGITSGPTGTNQGCPVPASVKSYPPNSYTQLSLTLQPPPNGPSGERWVGTAICNLNTIGIGASAVATSSTFIAHNVFGPSFFTPSYFLS